MSRQFAPLDFDRLFADVFMPIKLSCSFLPLVVNLDADAGRLTLFVFNKGP